MHCAVHADARTTPLPLHPSSTTRSPSSFPPLSRALVTHLFLDPLFSSIPRVCLPNSLFHHVFPASSSLCTFLPAAVFPPPSAPLSLSLGLSIRVYALFTRRFLSRSFLDRRQLLSLSPSRSISVVTPDLSLFLSLFLSVCHSRCISTLPPMRIGSPFFEFRGTTHAWYRHRRGTFLDFRLRLRWTGRERGINARPRSIFRHPSPGRPRRCVE